MHQSHIGGSHKPCFLVDNCAAAPLVVFDESMGWELSAKQKEEIVAAARKIGGAFANVVNGTCSRTEWKYGECDYVTGSEAFIEIFGGPITFTTHSNSCSEFWERSKPGNEYTCWGTAAGRTILLFSNMPRDVVPGFLQFIVHEIFHVFDYITGYAGRAFVGADSALMRRDGMDSLSPWQQDRDSQSLEVFADFGIAWLFGHYNPKDPDSAAYASGEMNRFMEYWILSLFFGH